MSNSKIIHFNSNGNELYGEFFFQKDFKEIETYPIVMMATGDGRKGSNSATWKPLINSILAIGFPVFIFDFYSLGNSSGDIKQFTPTVAIQNLSDAVNLVKSQKWVNKTRIGMLASSFGGAVSLIVQSKLNVFKCIGLKSPVSFFAEVYESELKNYTLSEWKEKKIIDDLPFHYNAYLDSIKYNIYDMATKINSKILIVHGDKDNIVPIEESIRLNCLLSNSELKVLKNVNHGYKEDNSLEKLSSLQQNFFKKYL